MKIRMGLYTRTGNNPSELIEPIGNTVEATRGHLFAMNFIASSLDKELQEIKAKQGVRDETYISFDYVR